MLTILNLRKFLLFWGDIVCLYLSLLGTIFLSLQGEPGKEWAAMHFLPFSIIYFFWLVVFYVFGLYDLKIIKSGPLFYTKILGALLACLGLGIVFFYLIPFFGIAPKTNLVLNLALFGILFIIWRKIFYAVFSGRISNRLAIVGQNQQAQELAKEIALRPYLGYRLVELDTGRDLLPQIKENRIDTLIIPDNLETNSWLTKNLYQSLPARVSFMDWAKAYEIICQKIPVSFVGQAWFLKNLKEGEKGLYDKAKHKIDVVLALLLLILSSPLWLIISLLIKLGDGGPVFYRQERVGKDRKLFSLFKFRSMKCDAESKTGAVWAKKEDPRTTGIGKWLRKSHLDELPQMINILKGEISLVGPRPERPEFVEDLEKEIPYYHIRHLIKPGFTGWAQLKFRYGRSVMDAKEKFQYDLYYMKNRSLFLDIGILLKTFQLFFKKE